MINDRVVHHCLIQMSKKYVPFYIFIDKKSVGEKEIWIWTCPL
jgi:hypothetical protein